MIKLVTETSFKDNGGIYRRFNIQVLHLVDIPYDMLIANLDGYDINVCGLYWQSFTDNKELVYQHIDTMFGLKDLDNYKFIIIEKNIAYRRCVEKGHPFYGAFLEMYDDDFDKEYKKFLEN